MEPKFVDIHSHVQFAAYDEDRDAVIERSLGSETWMINVGTQRDTSENAITLAEKYPEGVYATVGLHPIHTDKSYHDTKEFGGEGEAFTSRGETFDSVLYEKLARHPKVVAIGECGLDYFRPAEVNEEVKQVQRELFKKHIALATELNKPLIIHARPSKGTQDAYQELISILKEAKTVYPNLCGDVHFFVGGLAEAQALIALDFTISFTAVITFARDYDEVIRSVPLTSILSETDAPYVAPASRRGQRNDPLSVKDVVSKIASIRSEDLETVRSTLLATSRRMFVLP